MDDIKNMKNKVIRMSKNFDFTTVNVKNATSYTIGIIAAMESKKIYEVIDQAIRSQYPTYFEQQEPNACKIAL
jgi:hypothetical protein